MLLISEDRMLQMIMGFVNGFWASVSCLYVVCCWAESTAARSD